MSNISKIKIKNADGTEKEYNVSDSNIGTKIGNLEELITENKSNLVNAINEVSENGSKKNFVDCTLDEYNAMETHDPDTYYNVIDDGLDTNSILNQIGDITQLNTEEKSNLVGAINEVASKGGDASAIDSIPVDLTGIYNTQVIGYDETQGKLVPMMNAARTEIVLPNAIIPAPWNVEIISDTGGTLQGDPTTFGVTGAVGAWSCKAEFTTPFVLSEFTSLYTRASANKTVITVLFSKTSDFKIVEAQYSLEKVGSCDITHLIGSYYMQVIFGCTTNYNATLTDLYFSQGG